MPLVEYATRLACQGFTNSLLRPEAIFSGGNCATLQAQTVLSFLPSISNFYGGKSCMNTFALYDPKPCACCAGT